MNWFERKLFKLRTGADISVIDNPIDEVVIKFKDMYISVLTDCKTGDIESMAWSKDPTMFTVPIREFWVASNNLTRGQGVTTMEANVIRKTLIKYKTHVQHGEHFGIDLDTAEQAINQYILDEKAERVKKNKSFCGCPMCTHHSEPYEADQRAKLKENLWNSGQNVES